MTAIALIAELRHAGIRLSARGDRLHIEAKPGAVTPAIRDRLTAAKPEVLALLTDYTDTELQGYQRALGYGALMDAGQCPPDYTEPATCAGCGPVWLWPGVPARVLACPWCFRRKAGKAFPQPDIALIGRAWHGEP